LPFYHRLINRFLIPGSALLGATLLSIADLIARVVLRPAE
jgi:ABC-type Fe3+-siderophore transport system permease subunit